MPLSINHLTLHHFRNHAALTLETGGKSMVLTGANGAGKTNILEAISLLSPGRGLRKARLGDITSQGAADGNGWVVAADIHGLQGKAHLGTALDMQSESERRLVKIDGEKTKSQTALADHLAMNWHTPQMDGLFLASDGDRRRFLDRLIYSFDTEHLTRTARYEHAMRERNRLLAMGSRDDVWLATLEEQMAQGSVAIAEARLSLLARLSNAIEQQKTSAFPKAQLTMTGSAEQWLHDEGASQCETLLLQAIKASRHRDAAAGRALVGAHRSILGVHHAEKQQPAAQCSTGEQKALLLSILLAHAQARKDWLGKAPILLLDETVAHLDASRRTALAEVLQSLDTQVWLTGTDAADFAAFEGFAMAYSVCDGKLEKQP